MGFSLRNWLEEATAQVNPFDNGKTAQTVRTERQRPAPAVTQNKRTIQNGVVSKPKQNVLDKVRDVFDANTEMDNYKRNSGLELARYNSLLKATQSPNIEIANQANQRLRNAAWRSQDTPVVTLQDNVQKAGDTLENVVKNIGYGIVEAPVAIGRFTGNAAAVNTNDYKNAQASEEAARKIDTQVYGTMLKTLRDPTADENRRQAAINYLNTYGGEYQSGMDEVRAKVASENDPKRIAAASASLIADLATLGVASVSKAGVKGAYQTARAAQLAKGASTARQVTTGLVAGSKRLGIDTAKTAAIGGIAGGTSAYIQDPNATFKQALTGAGTGAAMGAGMPLAFIGASSLPTIAKATGKGVKATTRLVRDAGKPTGEALQNLKLKETQIGAQIQDLLGKRSIAETRRPDLIPILDERINAKYAELDSVKKSMNSRNQSGYVRNPLANPDGTPRIGKGADPLEALKANRDIPQISEDTLALRLKNGYTEDFARANYARPNFMDYDARLLSGRAKNAGVSVKAIEELLHKVTNARPFTTKDIATIKKLRKDTELNNMFGEKFDRWLAEEPFVKRNYVTPVKTEAVAPKGAPIEKTPQPAPDPTAALKQEALKYKSADEFRKSLIYNDDIILHQTGKNTADKIRTEGFKAGKETGLGEKRGEVYGMTAYDWNKHGKFSKDTYARDGSGVSEVAIDTKGLKIADRTNQKFTDEEYVKGIHKQIPDGYDGVKVGYGNGVNEVLLKPEVANARRFNIDELYNQAKSGAPIEKTPTIQDALEGKNTKIPKSKSEAIPQDTTGRSQPQNQLQNQTAKSVDGQATTQKTQSLEQKQQLDQSVQSSSTPIIQQEARPKTAKEVTKQISSKDAEIYVKTNTKIVVDQRGGQKVVDVNKIDTTKTGVTKTNLKTGKVTSYMIDDKGEFVPDNNGAYKIVTDDDGKLTQIRIGDEVYTSEQLGDLTGINNYGSTVATQRRNLERAIPDEKTRNTVISLVVDHQQAQATKMVARHSQLKKGMQGVLDDLGISFGIGRGKAKKVSAAIQDFGEGKRDYDSLVQEYGKPYADKIVNADKWFREQYDTLLEEMNTTLTRYGYDPIPKRANYYTHFQDETLWRKYGLKMQEINEAFGNQAQEANPTGTRGAISNQMAGQSEFMTPNKRFNPFSLQRKGDQRTADAFGAFERYMSPTLNNIYMTPSITRARVIAKAIAMENDRVGKNVNLVVSQMREWANHLAGKSNQLDRFMIDRKGLNQMLQASNWIQKKVGGNSIVGNFATAVMQPIVLAQTAGKAGYKNTLLALMQELSTSHGKNAPIRQSEFLKRRYTNVEAVTRGKVQRGADVAGVPLRVIEETSARITWNAHYNTALEKGLKGKQAIKYADIEAEKTMAGRSIGEKPELYRSKTAGPVTQFMLEVNNYWQQVGKEMTPAQVGKTFVAAYGINLVLQEMTGRSVGFNPIDAAVGSIQTLTDDDKEGGQKAKEVAQRWAGEAVVNTPGATSVLDLFMDDQDAKKFFGTQSPVGRYGVGSTYGQIYDNTLGKVLDGKYGEAAAYTAMPWGYNQAQKTVKGIKAVSDGKLTDKDGDTTVEIPQTPGNFVKGALFGPSAIDEVNQYYNNIGVRKEDQKPVKNQTNSKASKMGVVTGTGSTKLTLDQAKNIQKKEYGGKYAKMTESEIEQLAKTDTEARQYLKSLEATKAAYGKTPTMPDNLPDNAKKLLERESRLTKDGKGKWNKLATTDKSIVDTLKKWNNGRDLPVNNETAKAWANYEKKRVEGTLGKLEAVDEKKKILRGAYNSQLNEDEKDLYKLSKTRLIDAYNQGLINDKNIDNALAVENQLFEAGLIDKKTLHGKLGMATGAKGKSKKSSGRKSGGKTRSIGNLEYKMFGFGDPKAVTGQLRKLIEQTQS